MIFKSKKDLKNLEKEDWMWDDDEGHSIKEIGYRDGTKILRKRRVC